VQSERVFVGGLGPGRLPRLAGEVGADWPGRFELRFGRDQEGRAVVKGWVRLTLYLTCQRCMGEMALPVDAGISWGLLHTEAESDGLPEALDPVVVGEGPVNPWGLLEDELLLAIPNVPRHPAGACPGGAQAVLGPTAGASGSPPGVPEKDNPFAVLAVLKSGQPGDSSEN